MSIQNISEVSIFSSTTTHEGNKLFFNNLNRSNKLNLIHFLANFILNNVVNTALIIPNSYNFPSLDNGVVFFSSDVFASNSLPAVS